MHLGLVRVRDAQQLAPRGRFEYTPVVGSYERESVGKAARPAPQSSTRRERSLPAAMVSGERKDAAAAKQVMCCGPSTSHLCASE